MADEIKGNVGLGKIDTAIDKLMKLADAASKVNNRKVKVETDFKRAISETTKLNEELEKAYVNLKGKSNRNDYFVSEEKALSNLSAAWDRYNKRREGGKDVKNNIGEIVRWGNAYIALGGNIDKANSALSTFYKEQSKQDKFTSSKGYQYTVESFRDLFDIMKQMQSSGYDLSVLSKGFKVSSKDSNDIDAIISAMQTLYDKVTILDSKGEFLDFQPTINQAKQFIGLMDKLSQMTKDIPNNLKMLHEQITIDSYYNFDKDVTDKAADAFLKRERQRQNAIQATQKIQEETVRQPSQVDTSVDIQIEKQKELQDEIKTTKEVAENKSSNTSIVDVDALIKKAQSAKLTYEDIKAVIEEIASISSRMEKHTVALSDSKYALYDGKWDNYGIKIDDVSIEGYKQALKEVYTLYKNVQSAIKNNGGMFKGFQYDENDLTTLKGTFGGIVESIIGMGGTIDDIMAKLPRMTKEFKGISVEAAEDYKQNMAISASYDTEARAIEESNRALVERLRVLNQIWEIASGNNVSKTVKAEGIVGESWDFERAGFKYGDVEQHAKQICQIFGIEIPDAVNKATSEIEKTAKITAGEMNDIRNQTTDLSGSEQQIANEERKVEKTKETTAAIKEQQQAKEKLNATATTPPPDTTANTQASSEGIKREAEELKNVSTSAGQAAEQKRKFAEANAEVLASITNSLNGLNLESDGFVALQKLLNRINTLSQDGAEGAPSRIQVITDNINKLREAFNGEINENSLLRALDQLASRGDALNDLATVLKATRKDIEKAQGATNKNGGKPNDKSHTSFDEKAFNDALNKGYTEQIQNINKIIKLREYIIAHQNDTEYEVKERCRQKEEEIGKLEARNAEIEASRTASSIEGNQRLLEAIERRKKAEENAVKKADESTRDSYTSQLNKSINNIDKALNNQLLSPQMRQELEAFKAELQAVNTGKPLAELEQDVARLTEREKELVAATKDEHNIMAKDVNIAQRYRKMADALAKNSKMSKEAQMNIKAMMDELKGGNVTGARLKEITAEFDRIYAAEIQAGRAGLSFFDKMKKSAEGLVRYLGTYVSMYRIVGVIKDGINTVKDLDTALVDLRKTTVMSSSQLNEFYFNSNKVAKQLGVTTKEIIQQAANWSRLGYSSKEAATEMAALSSQFAAISPGMSVDEAQTGLVSLMKAYKVEVNDVQRTLLDNINVLGNKFGESNADVIAGMERAGATLAALGESAESSFALFTGAQEVIQNAETVGVCLAA